MERGKEISGAREDIPVHVGEFAVAAGAQDQMPGNGSEVIHRNASGWEDWLMIAHAVWLWGESWLDMTRRRVWWGALGSESPLGGDERVDQVARCLLGRSDSHARNLVHVICIGDPTTKRSTTFCESERKSDRKSRGGDV